MHPVTIPKADFLVGLFTSSGSNVRGYGEDIITIRRLLTSGVLALDEVRFEIPSEPISSSPMWKVYFNAFTGNTSATHGWLKWASWNWLKSQGEQNPMYEQAYPGGKADVYGQALHTIIECGDTAPDKLLSTLVDSSAYSAWVLVPYPSDLRFYIQESVAGWLLIGYRFKRLTPNLTR